MKVTIKKAHISNFKGCKELKFGMGSVNEVTGGNGVGKTTIATAWLWLMSDRDYSLKSNPRIYPLDVEECTPRVEFLLDVDGVELKIAKSQKRIRKAENVVTYTNNYEINSINYGERDFKAKLSEYGIEFDLFLPLTHIDVFTNSKTNDMRKVLFSMTNKKSDFEIAKSLKNCKDLQKLLETYTMEEIKAMQSANVKVIRENYGKSGEILRAKIEGLESAKVDSDVAEYELGKKAILEMLESNKQKQAEALEQYKHFEELSSDILHLKFKISDMQRKEQEKNDKKRVGIKDTISDVKIAIQAHELVINSCKEKIESYKNSIEKLDKDIAKSKHRCSIIKRLKFDDRGAICTQCGQKYPSDKITEIKAKFSDKRANELAEVIEEQNNLIKVRQDVQQGLKKEETIKKKAEKEVFKLQQKLMNLNTKINDLDNSDGLNVTQLKEYKLLKEKEKDMNNANGMYSVINKLKEEENKLQNELGIMESKIAASINNDSIDEKIDELRKLQLEYEQRKANCEKILYQIDLVNRKKNELLTDDINSHFNLVDFKLFDYRKNGDYLECCVPRYKGKDLGIETNTGLEMLMKLDIIMGLQKFYKLELPVFIDCAESLTIETKKLIEQNLNCQLTYLIVSQGKLLVNGEEV